MTRSSRGYCLTIQDNAAGMLNKIWLLNCILEYSHFNLTIQIHKAINVHYCTRLILSIYNLSMHVFQKIYIILAFKIVKMIYYGGRTWRRGTKCDCKIDWLWVRSPLAEVKYLFTFIFSFLRSGVEAKRGVEFRHSERNVSRIRQKVGDRVS